MSDDAVVLPKDRFEWERIIRRADLPLNTKAVAFTVCQYGNKDGQRIYPGIDRLARVCRVDERTVRRHLKTLRDQNFLRIVRGSERRHAQRLADEYRLVIPVNFTEQNNILTPDEQTKSRPLA